VVLVVVLAAGIVVALARSGDDESADDQRDPGSSAITTAPARSKGQIDTIWGAPAEAPSGVREAPATVDAFTRPVDCRGLLVCSAAALQDDVVLAYSLDGGATTHVERVSTVDGSVRWDVDVDTPAEAMAVASAGPVVILASNQGDRRFYRAFDPDDGRPLWENDYASSDRTIRASAQPSESTLVLMMTAAFTGEEGAAGAVAIDYATGEELWVEEGRILTTDRRAAYVSLDGTVVARDIENGNVLWTAADVPVDDDGRSPAGRLGAVVDDILVTVSGGEVLGLGIEDGTEAWDARVPLVAGDLPLGAAQVVSSVEGAVVVSASGGDLAVDPRSGTTRWNMARDPLVVSGASNVWFATADHLVAGQVGGTLRTLSLEDGSVAAGLQLGPGERAESASPIVDGVVVLADDGATAYGLGGLEELWRDPGLAGARALVAVDGGVVVVGDEAITLHRAP